MSPPKQAYTKYADTINGKRYIFEITQKRKRYLCKCLDMPHISGEGATAQHAINACINQVRNALGLNQVRVIKKVSRTWIREKKKAWWHFW